jgi:hypothetical protein
VRCRACSSCMERACLERRHCRPSHLSPAERIFHWLARHPSCNTQSPCRCCRCRASTVNREKHLNRPAPAARPSLGRGRGDHDPKGGSAPIASSRTLAGPHACHSLVGRKICVNTCVYFCKLCRWELYLPSIRLLIPPCCLRPAPGFSPTDRPQQSPN